MNNRTRNAAAFKSAFTGLRMNRSRFHVPTDHKTTFNAGKLIPLYAAEILPGDTVQMDVRSLIRGSTPVHPVMDNAYFDIFAFFVPNRLVWDHWKEFCGENNVDEWTQKTEYSVPCVNLSSIVTAEKYVGTFMDYLGIPYSAVGPVAPAKTNFVNALYPRSYVKAWNDFFRNQNTQSPAHLYTDDTDRALSYNGASGDYVTEAELGGALCPVNKDKDYFTACLPEPQKHAPITLPLGDTAPVAFSFDDSAYPISNNTLRFFANAFAGESNKQYPLVVSNNNGLNPDNTVSVKYMNTPYDGSGSPLDITGWNVLGTTDLSQASAITVNALRLAFQTQKFYEKQALGGSRYTEILLSMFGVRSSDARLQRSEYLGGKRIDITQYQVPQTSSDTESSGDLGDTGAFSHTFDETYLVNKSFEEHGILLVVGCVRQKHTYQQGIFRQYTRRNLFDYYFPVFANIGEQAVLRREIYASADPDEGAEPFGYQEAWADYRFKPSYTSGYMRSGVPGSLDVWHYGDFYENAPSLNDDFTEETPEFIDRTLKVPSTTSHQFIAEFYFDAYYTRVMPIYSVPGLIDHN